jgi:hypothetical protein
MLSTRYSLAVVMLVAVSAVVLLSCGESETDLSGGSGVAALTGPKGPKGPRGEQLTDDPLPIPSLDIEKSTNGFDADQPPGPTIPVGDPVTWEYTVTNTGDVELIDILVKDDMLGDVCTMDYLAPGEMFTCQVQGTATAGQYKNVASVYWWSRQFPEFGDADTSHYYGAESAKSLDIEKSTNGKDADAAPGPMVPVGGPVTWEYTVTNTGDIGITEVIVEDDVLGQICTIDYLAPGETVVCQAAGTATAGQYENIGTVSWLDQGVPEFGDADTSHYFGMEPAIRIEKSTNGEDADVAPGPTVSVGAPVTWKYVVTNLGNAPLTNIDISDDQLGPICLRPGPLAPGDTVLCIAMGVAAAGQYANLGSVQGTAPDGTVYMDDDPSHYYGEEPSGDDGCSHGYWKNHEDDWPPTGYSPGQSVQSVFADASTYPDIGSATLMEALEFGGGDGVEGGARILLKQAVASLLNAAHPAVLFPRSPVEVISSTDAALASGDRHTMTDLGEEQDDDNNLGCPLSNDGSRRKGHGPGDRR